MAAILRMLGGCCGEASPMLGLGRHQLLVGPKDAAMRLVARDLQSHHNQAQSIFAGGATSSFVVSCRSMVLIQ